MGQGRDFAVATVVAAWLLQKMRVRAVAVYVVLGVAGWYALHESGVHVPEISIPVSLGVICSVLIITTITSLRASRKQAEAEAAAGRGDDPVKSDIDA